jgi:hypothetical protein
MAIGRRRTTSTDSEEYRTRLLRLQRIGVATGEMGILTPKRERLILQQIDPELARVHDLMHDEVAVVLPAKLIILRSSVMIMDVRVTLPWSDWPLECDDPRGHRLFHALVRDLPEHPPRILNEWLIGRQAPLRPCQRDGVIVATGRSSVPSEYHDEAIVPIRLSLCDERGDEINHEFFGRVDRNFKRQDERKQQERRLAQSERTGLFELKEENVDDHQLCRMAGTVRTIE